MGGESHILEARLSQCPVANAQTRFSSPSPAYTNPQSSIYASSSP